MAYRLSIEEFAVLSFLHEHAEGYDRNSGFERGEIARALAIDLKSIKKAASYLGSIGLVGAGIPAMATFATENQVLIWLTGEGEQFMRELDEQFASELKTQVINGTGVTKITVGVYRFIYGVGQAAIAKALGDWIAGGRSPFH